MKWGKIVLKRKIENEWYPGGLQISLHIDLPDF